jgi:hypothetical protein
LALTLMERLCVDAEQGVVLAAGVAAASEAAFREMLRAYAEHPASGIAHLTPTIGFSLQRQVDTRSGEQQDPTPATG